jgi:4-hydroxybenzoate polyprenyltransferase
MNSFSNLSWEPALIATIGTLVIGTGAVWWLYEQYDNWRRSKRRNRRLFQKGNLYHQGDL